MNPFRLPSGLDPVERAFRISLIIFASTIVFSVVGSLLLRIPFVMALIAPVYPVLVKTPTWLYMALLPVVSGLMYVRSSGTVLTLFFFLWGCFIGGMSELLGTSTGVPFGAYAYTTWFGPKILDHVPYFIPLSWFAMSIICLDLAGRLTNRMWERVLVGALFMVLWDVSLDPAMSRAFPFWSYPEQGFFFGMPAMNWFGWFVVSAVIIWGYEVIGGGLRESNRWAPLVYVMNCAFPLLISLVYGLEEAFLFGLIATALPILAIYGRRHVVRERRRVPA